MRRPALLRRLARSDRGASLVEFAVVLPMFLILLATIVEGGRMTWSYQSAAAGVRDASRYLSRIVPETFCESGTPTTFDATLLAKIRESAAGATLFPNSRRVTVDSVVTECVEGSGWPGTDPVVRVTATVTIALPLAAVFQLVGGTIPATFEVKIADQTRVFGT
jgi:Flp pilus assembly pilin Flp